MKKNIYFTSIFLLAGLVGTAQPVILDGSNVPAVGFSVAITTGTPTGIGSSGANQTWDFSAVSFTSIGQYNVISPATTPMAASFANADYAYNISSAAYSFFDITPTAMDVMAYSIVSAGAGNDYTPNPRTVLPFPFAFGNTFTDTWQKVGGSTENVTLTYDAYGTLITPSATYTNVVRVKEAYGNGDDYQWYTLNPLMSIMVYDHNNNLLYHTAATPATTVETTIDYAATVDVHPNPTADYAVFSLSGLQNTHNAIINISDVLGKTMMTIPVATTTVSVDIRELATGTYFYNVVSENGNASGKMYISR